MMWRVSRYLEPRYLTQVCDRWSRDKTNIIQLVSGSDPFAQPIRLGLSLVWRLIRIQKSRRNPENVFSAGVPRPGSMAMG